MLTGYPDGFMLQGTYVFNVYHLSVWVLGLGTIFIDPICILLMSWSTWNSFVTSSLFDQPYCNVQCLFCIQGQWIPWQNASASVK